MPQRWQHQTPNNSWNNVSHCSVKYSCILLAVFIWLAQAQNPVILSATSSATCIGYLPKKEISNTKKHWFKKKRYRTSDACIRLTMQYKVLFFPVMKCCKWQPLSKETGLCGCFCHASLQQKDSGHLLCRWKTRVITSWHPSETVPCLKTKEVNLLKH